MWAVCWWQYFALERRVRHQYLTDADLSDAKCVLGVSEELELSDQSEDAKRMVEVLTRLAAAVGEDDKDDKIPPPPPPAAGSPVAGAQPTPKSPVAGSRPSTNPKEKLKIEIFRLDAHLRVDMFSEEFIGYGGLEVLMACAQKGGTTASYALKALSRAMWYVHHPLSSPPPSPSLHRRRNSRELHLI
jgi:hypothetical protein